MQTITEVTIKSQFKYEIKYNQTVKKTSQNNLKSLKFGRLRFLGVFNIRIFLIFLIFKIFLRIFLDIFKIRFFKSEKPIGLGFSRQFSSRATS